LIRRRFAVFDRVFFAASSSLACESSYLVGALRSRGGGRNGRVKLGINKDLQVPRPDSAFSAADVIKTERIFFLLRLMVEYLRCRDRDNTSPLRRIVPDPSK
jgi:hypothetical protein